MTVRGYAVNLMQVNQPSCLTSVRELARSITIPLRTGRFRKWKPPTPQFSLVANLFGIGNNPSLSGAWGFALRRRESA
jgi:hypothetical protein